jgi:Uma2 family endonuclease
MTEPLPEKQLYTRKEYLLMEASADIKSEYYQGEIFAMTGGTPNHSTICFNLTRRVGEAIDNTNCRGFESNMKLFILEADAYVYPNAMVVCGDVKLAEDTTDAITNPVLIIEVLSPGTESFDRGRKFDYYRTIPSFKEYVLVSQDKPKVELYFRQSETVWQYRVIEGLDKAFLLQSLDYELKLADIYAKTGLMTL